MKPVYKVIEVNGYGYTWYEIELKVWCYFFSYWRKIKEDHLGHKFWTKDDAIKWTNEIFGPKTRKQVYP